MAIPLSVINEVRERTNIAEIISERVQLKRSGRNLTGLCPFHNEKTPSFSVRDEDGYFHCFGCGKSGSVFDFVMETRGFNFAEAVRFLAKRLNIPVPEQSEKVKTTRKEGSMREVMRSAAGVYYQFLVKSPDAAAARDYLTRRGITVDVIRNFGLGYAPRAWDFIREHVKSKEVAGAELEDLLFTVGLRKKSPETSDEAKRAYDAFRDRIIFPISRSDGAVIALGGRVIKSDDAPKYINSPESPIYAKRKALYGLHKALPEMRNTREVFLVEGYFDVISMAVRGFSNTVATCGTSLTEDHVKVLKRFVDRVTLLFDGDQAGRKAAVKSFDLFLNSGLDVQVVFLDQADDPDTLCQRESYEKIRELFAARIKPIEEIFLAELVAGIQGVGSQTRAAEEYVSRVRRVESPVEQEILLKKGATHLDLSYDRLEKLLNSLEAEITSSFSVTEAKPEAAHAKDQVEKRQETPTERQFKALCFELLLAALFDHGTLDKLWGIDQDNRIREIIPERLLSVFDKLLALRLGNAESWLDSASDVSKVEMILRDHSISDEIVLRELRRRLLLGGARINAVLDDIERFAERIHSDRAQGTQADLSPLDYAQQKLISRRKLEESSRINK
ncbi:DNA primase [bacterium]|nr:DNA primase [bacterium]